MRIVFASLPAYGHLYPMLPLALACADAGHEVTVATGEPFLDRLPLPTARGVAGDALHDMESETARNHPELVKSASPLDFATVMFGETVARRVSPCLLDLFEHDRPDLVVYEASNAGAAVAADLFGVRAVAFGIGLWNPLVPRWQEIAVADQRDRWGARVPGELGAFPGGYLDVAPPSLQGPTPLPATRQPIRTVPWAPPGELPAWLTGDAARPRVYVTLGTVAFGAVEVLRRAVIETAAHDVDVLVAVGPKGDAAALGELPANVHTERFVPQADVLRRVDLVVHHGGSGTMLGALAHGLPQLLLPQGADQPFNAMAIEHAGAGRALANDAQVPGAIGAAVEALLTEGPERLAAKRIAAEIAAMPAPAEVVSSLF